MDRHIGPIKRMFKSDGFTCESGEDGWQVAYKKWVTGRVTKVKTLKITISYKHLPKDSNKDFVLGYVRCYAIQEGWI